MHLKLNGYLHDYNDAVLVAHSVRLGLLEPITRRLTMVERQNIASGDIFCFVESEDGMKRWTDGKIWSPSKVNGHFLSYKEVPKDYSKSSLKKLSKTERMRLEQPHDDLFDFMKKTISVNINNVTYHIISYYQTIFDKRSISEFPFFKKIKIALAQFQELNDDNFINHQFGRNKTFFIDRFGLEEMNYNNIRTSNINREELEKIAASVIRYRFL